MPRINLLVLAAGSGKRLSQGDSILPKVLTKINGKTILDRILYNFKNFETINRYLVTGFKKNEFQFFHKELTLIHNNKYEETNMLYSFMVALDHIDTNIDLFITYGDIIYTQTVIKNMLNSKGNIIISSDKNWFTNWNERFKNPLDDLEIFQVDKIKKIIKKIGGKPNSYNQIEGQYMGLVLIKAEFLIKIKNILNELLKKDMRFIQKGYMTDFFEYLISQSIEINFIENSEPWFEIDNIFDLELLQNKIKEFDEEFFNYFR